VTPGLSRRYDEDATARGYDAATGRFARAFVGHGAGLTGCAFSVDGARLATAARDGEARVWDFRGGALLQTFAGHGGAVTAVDFSRSGRVVTSCADGRTRLWDASKSPVLATLRGHAGPATCCAFSPDGASVFTGSGDATCAFWDAATGCRRRVLTGHGQRPTIALI
jgi:WD40 repeat protein